MFYGVCKTIRAPAPVTHWARAPHVTFTATLEGGYYCSEFTDEDTAAQESVSYVPKVMR